MSAETPELPERISDTDLERHLWLAQKLQAAAETFANVQGAWKVWGDELHERYGLAQDGSEGVDPDGTIRRKMDGD